MKEMRHRLTDLGAKVKTLESDLLKKKQHIETADTRINDLNHTLKEKDRKNCLLLLSSSCLTL